MMVLKFKATKTNKDSKLAKTEVIPLFLLYI